MNLEQILTYLQNGEITVKQAEDLIKYKPFEDIKEAIIDYNRAIRTGCPEVIYCESKTYKQLEIIIQNMKDNKAESILATRADKEMFGIVQSFYPKAVYHDAARIIAVGKGTDKMKQGELLVVCAGTSDIPVSEEAAVTAEFLGCTVNRLYDVGVAGIHRLLSKLEMLNSASAIIVVAGMEGALASVVGGLTDKPVIAVPTSVGYGASFKGVAALLAMLNSCAGGVSVVNIDNGFGAGILGSRILGVKG